MRFILKKKQTGRTRQRKIVRRLHKWPLKKQPMLCI